ncbi:sensor domain-containing phosphodiesterase [Erwinia aphidicola]|uniref:Sensor domain-containing phosphodiesterase n=1 Tax=Erwinia aphidicola TaxID=68334 RepID=A0ABU8DLF6_ERWAP|nr:sensor domain-containing phosphodiesterase [Erwinia aphidicola]KMV72261.1 histidine kinase [bacteria symbiont BFo1 of Frankliniella occidentalis]KYP91674.1 histidine kinase [bacteria symbiont BFo1 of Frankliniella occidentalis]MBD1378333.1 sensor domain-containing phosphodiesterase [Erwinia aphidicola]
MSGTFSSDDAKRLAALEMLKSEDAARDDILKKFSQLASELLEIPGGFVSVLDDENQYIKAACNFDLKQTSLQDAFCRHTLELDDVLVCADTHLDPRFSAHPLTLGAPFIRFYAGAPLRNREGIIIGTLCVTDTQPHAFSADKAALLALLAGLVVGYLDAWYITGYQDVVTLLPNRQRLLKDIELLQQAGNSEPHNLTLIDCIDMPRAYEIARSVGMNAVETLLKEMAATLRTRLRLDSDDVLYTVALGRFALLSDKPDAPSGRELSQRLGGIRAQIFDNITVDAKPYLGEVSFVPVDSQVSEVLRRAVSALHEAISLKQNYMAYNADSDGRRNQSFRLLNDLAAALRGTPGLYLVYQPQISLRNGKPVGLETLLRWDHPLYGNIPPDEFIPLAAQTNLMEELTDWVLDHTLAQLKLWRSKGLNLPASVNLCVSDFSRPDFANKLEEKLLRAGLQAEDLNLECLETEQVLESAEARRGLDMLKLRGFRIALDDFGSGYSNINTLRRIPVDVIKLDRSLIQQLSHDPASEVIARHVITMLKELEYVVLAEGVEDLQTLASLQRLGCDEIQGFYYSRPLIPEGLESWLSRYYPQAS